MGSATKISSVFVYGSLQAAEVVKDLLGRVPKFQFASVADFRRYSIKERTYPAVVPQKGCSVIGQVYLDVTEREQDILDIFEGNAYEKVQVRAALLGEDGKSAVEGGGEVDAWMYTWAGDLERLYGEWDYNVWRERHLRAFMDNYDSESD